MTNEYACRCTVSDKTSGGYIRLSERKRGSDLHQQGSNFLNKVYIRAKRCLSCRRRFTSKKFGLFVISRPCSPNFRSEASLFRIICVHISALVDVS